MADLGCSPNAAVAFDFLMGKGLRDFQAAAVIGNLQWESHLNPRLEARDTNGLPGRGIAMWQPPRWQNLLEFAAGRDPWALDTQLDFLWHELQSGGFGLQQLLTTTTPEDATVVFQNQFEHPLIALAHTDKRIALANAALYALPRCNLPLPAPRGRAVEVATAAGVGALVVAVGYGLYRLLTREPKPEPAPILPPPRFRPEPIRPTWGP